MADQGERFINAPLQKVWTALQDAQTLASCFAAPGMVEQVPGGLALAPPIADRVSVAATPDTLTYAGTKGTLRVVLAEHTPQMTRLAWTLDAPGAAGVQAQADSLLDAFGANVAGPREFAASGLAGAQAATTEPK